MDEPIELDLQVDDVRQLHRHLRSFEDQYDKAQAELRRAASVWIVAGLAGIGTTLSTISLHTVGEGLGLPESTYVDPFSISAFIAFLVVLGLGNLWQVDQGVYQKLLHGVFSLGLKVEQRLSRLERVRTTLYAFSDNASGPISQFYRIPLVGFFAVQAVFTGLYVYVLTTKILAHENWPLAIEVYALNFGVGVALLGAAIFSLVFGTKVERATRSDDIVDKAEKIEKYLSGDVFDRTRPAPVAMEIPPPPPPAPSPPPPPAPSPATDAAA